MHKRILSGFAYQDGFRKGVKANASKMMFAEVYTETQELVFKYDTGEIDLIVRKKFNENKDMWKEFCSLKPTDIIETLLQAMKLASNPPEDLT